MKNQIDNMSADKEMSVEELVSVDMDQSTELILKKTEEELKKRNKNLNIEEIAELENTIKEKLTAYTENKKFLDSRDFAMAESCTSDQIVNIVEGSDMSYQLLSKEHYDEHLKSEEFITKREPEYDPTPERQLSLVERKTFEFLRKIILDKTSTLDERLGCQITSLERKNGKKARWIAKDKEHRYKYGYKEPFKLELTPEQMEEEHKEGSIFYRLSEINAQVMKIQGMLEKEKDSNKTYALLEKLHELMTQRNTLEQSVKSHTDELAAKAKLVERGTNLAGFSKRLLIAGGIGTVLYLILDRQGVKSTHEDMQNVMDFIIQNKNFGGLMDQIKSKIDALPDIIHGYNDTAQALQEIIKNTHDSLITMVDKVQDTWLAIKKLTDMGLDPNANPANIKKVIEQMTQEQITEGRKAYGSIVYGTSAIIAVWRHCVASMRLFSSPKTHTDDPFRQ